MISITPQGDIYLCKTPLENDYKNQLTFSNATSQLTYFNSKIDKTLNNYTYIKHDNMIKVGYPIDEIINCNYLFYRNEGFTTKYYYCFITNMEYVNENCTAITFKTDVWQTYQFNLTYNPCFVEREHVNDDIAGNHTIPEGLEIGDFVVDDIIKNQSLTASNCSYIMATTRYPYVQGGQIVGGADGGGSYNGIYSGLAYYYYRNTTKGRTALKAALEAFDNSGIKDAVNSIFIAPNISFQGTEEGVDTDWGRVNNSNSSVNMAWDSYSTRQILKPTTLNGYTPTNKKLLTYPYCYFVINNGNGGNALFKYELFKNPDTSNLCDFVMNFAITPGMSINLKPQYYKYNGDASPIHSDALMGGKFPVCGWVSDTYTNWLTQNSVNIKLGIVQGALQTGLGVAELGTYTGGTSESGVMNVVGGLSNIAGVMKDIYLHREFMTPQSEGNVNSGDVTFSTSNTTFTAYKMSIKQEFATIIDKYFSMFGYKINTVKIPNITGRTNWNFVKTIDCNFEGDIPQEHLQIIKQMFNRGVTLWHNPSTMYNYNNSNNVS